jgi:oligosaccharide repeat unit polymerase
VSQRLAEPLATALARASGACALFLVLLLVGYRVGGALGLGRRLATIRPHSRINQPAAIGVALAIGLAAQVAIVVRAGGPVASVETANAQAALSDSFVLFFLAGFAPAALAVWVAWRKPADRREWVALALSIAAVCGFFLVAGSRARVLILLLALAVIVNYLRRPWRARELVIGAVLFLAFVSSFLVFRNVAGDGSLREATDEGARHVLDERVILNDTTSYDQVLYATTLYGRSLRHERGRFLLDGLRSYVPRKIDPGKPEGGDILFRRAVWGEQFAAGRPPTAVGDLYIDFGFPGVAVGALLIGLLCHALLGLLRGGGPGREYRIALYALLLTVLYELVADTFSIAFGFVLTLVVPFLVAVHLFGRLPRAALPGSRAAA